MAAAIALNGPLGVRAAKRVINKASEIGGKELVDFDKANRVELNNTKDFAEALAAFSERRPSNFTGE